MSVGAQLQLPTGLDQLAAPAGPDPRRAARLPAPPGRHPAQQQQDGDPLHSLPPLPLLPARRSRGGQETAALPNRCVDYQCCAAAIFLGLV